MIPVRCLTLTRPSAALLALLVGLATGAAPLRAEDGAPVALSAGALSPGEVLEGQISGHAVARYALEGVAGQVLSVDLHAPGAVPDFLIRAERSGEVLFASGTAGTPVADLSLPADGRYLIEVVLPRALAGAGTPVAYDLAVALNPGDFADGLAGGPDWWQMTGVGDGDPMSVQDGPGPRYGARGVVRDGDLAQNRGCRISLGERRCAVRFAGSGLQGWVPGAALIEAAAPPAAGLPEGGPKGNGTPFDATGTVPCAAEGAAPTHACPFGVVRDGPGNAGVWIVFAPGRERQFLFEGGALAATSPADSAPQLTRADDLLRIEVGTERYEIPEAVISGG